MAEHLLTYFAPEVAPTPERLVENLAADLARLERRTDDAYAYGYAEELAAAFAPYLVHLGDFAGARQ